MPSAAVNQEAHQIVQSAQGARTAIRSEDWGAAKRLLTEAQDRIGRLLREVGDKTHEKMMVPRAHQGDRG
jgi:hypothetical protein